MGVIDVPGDELERVHDLLRRIADLMKSAPIRSMGAEVETLGHKGLKKAGHHFEKRWGDGRHVVGKDMEGIRDAAKAVADAFKEADEQTAAALTPQEPTLANPGLFESIQKGFAQAEQKSVLDAVQRGIAQGAAATTAATLPDAQTTGATLPDAQTTSATLPDAQIGERTAPDAPITS